MNGTTTPDPSAKAEAESPLAKEKTEAQDQQAIDEAHLKSVEAKQKQVAALVPDLSKVTPTPVEVKGEEAAFGASLAQRATAVAAEAVAKKVVKAVAERPNSRILITSDPALATSDAIYDEVDGGLDQLSTAAKQLIEDTAPPARRQAETIMAFGPVATAASALASALPGALSLLSAHRTLSTSPVTVDSLAAAAVVAGELCQAVTNISGVSHDEFRLVPKGGVVEGKVSALAGQRQQLVSRKIAFEDTKTRESARVAELTAEVKDTDTQLGAAAEADRGALESKLKEQREDLAGREVVVGECAVRVGLIDSTTAAIDQFTGSMQITAAGASRSPLATAILREQLHGSMPDGVESPDVTEPPDGVESPDAAEFTHVLLVKAEPGSAQQLVDDRPLWLKDTFSTIATSSVTYMLIETPGGKVIAGGSIGAEAKINGTIGEDFSIKAETPAAIA